MLNVGLVHFWLYSRSDSLGTKSSLRKPPLMSFILISPLFKMSWHFNSLGFLMCWTNAVTDSTNTIVYMTPINQNGHGTVRFLTFNYMCNQCLSALVAGSLRVLGFLHKWNWPPRHNWNIVESGVNHHKPKPNPVIVQKQTVGKFAYRRKNTSIDFKWMKWQHISCNRCL